MLRNIEYVMWKLSAPNVSTVSSISVKLGKVKVTLGVKGQLVKIFCHNFAE